VPALLLALVWLCWAEQGQCAAVMMALRVLLLHGNAHLILLAASCCGGCCLLLLQRVQAPVMRSWYP
jgi:hypothetical protein